jgi:hypothetical protein
MKLSGTSIGLKINDLRNSVINVWISLASILREKRPEVANISLNP